MNECFRAMYNQLKEDYDKLQSNWNSLREYAEAHIEVCENRLSTPFCNFEKATRELMIHQNYLDMMNELEGASDE